MISHDYYPCVFIHTLFSQLIKPLTQSQKSGGIGMIFNIVQPFLYLKAVSFLIDPVALFKPLIIHMPHQIIVRQLKLCLLMSHFIIQYHEGIIVGVLYFCHR